ncbi:exodeoxyribonuclease VII large subunit [Glutamicibacter sp.]|uniref:exodeoxyribonuclease VII large subunit n=1 Tax=Glutamicibacter sp. TaxID=1931995 RepID=UPI002B459455|nr:exodeoxyribonuclease VII large subunit [Glutamicibacter sp.]HJX78448.1 exodeoxyribonuclease VII large subunit [Glutamicibacter sp.]
MTLIDGAAALEIEAPSHAIPSKLQEGQQLVVTAKPNFDVWRRNPVWKVIRSSAGEGQPEVQVLPEIGPLELSRQKVAAEFGIGPKPIRNLEDIRPTEKIGNVVVICGQDAQVLADFKRGLHEGDRKLRVSVKAVEAHIQGTRAVDDISSKLKNLKSSDADAVIIIRGGGSYADFSVFDERDLIEAVVQCQVPVVTALGHSEHVPLAARAATANFAVPYDAGASIRKENSKRYFDGQPSYADLKIENQRLNEEEKIWRAHTKTSEGLLESLKRDLDLERIKNEEAQDQCIIAQKSANELHQQTYRDCLTIALQSIRLKSTINGLWWSLWTTLIAFVSFSSGSLSTGSAVLITVIAALWTGLTFTGGYRSRRILESQTWRTLSMGEDLRWVRRSLQGASSPRDLRWVLKRKIEIEHPRSR